MRAKKKENIRKNFKNTALYKNTGNFYVGDAVLKEKEFVVVGIRITKKGFENAVAVFQEALKNYCF